jgi:hypothetical protein
MPIPANPKKITLNSSLLYKPVGDMDFKGYHAELISRLISGKPE